MMLNIGHSFAAEHNILDDEQTLNGDLGDEYKNTGHIETINPKHVNNKHAANVSRNPASNEFKQNHFSSTSQNENDSDEKIELFKHASKAKIIILNKITTKSSELTIEVGETKAIGGLTVELHKCVRANDPYNNHNWMLLTIFDNKIIDNHQVFSGWVLSSNQSLSTLEHPVYEVIPHDCVVGGKD